MHATTDETNQYNLPTLQQNKTLIIYQSHNNNNKFRYLYTYRFIFNYIYESFFCVQQKEIRTNASHIMVRKNIVVVVFVAPSVHYSIFLDIIHNIVL